MVPAIFQKWPENPGTFGDMFGSINALFSGLAFAGIIYTILLQREELGLQREELTATRKELEGQKIQLEKQNDTLSKQAFENTFFQLLKTFNEIVYSTEISPTDIEKIGPRGGNTITTTGRDSFIKMWSYLKSRVETISNDTPIAEITNSINQSYSDFHNTYVYKIDHYFRILYNILKFVDASNETNKKFYVDIIRAQLSSPELSLIYYNCISDKGKEKLAPLVVKYNLLKHMPKNEITEKIKLSENINKKN